MSLPGYRMRRATLDDLESLRVLWRAMQLPTDDLERRLTEFQVAESDADSVCGGIALEINGRHGRLHSEVFADFSLADRLREPLWEGLQLLAANHGVMRLWTYETAPFWKQIGFQSPDAAALKKLPATWATAETPWLTLQLRDEAALEQALEKEFAKLKVQEQLRTAKMHRQARTLKLVATLLAVALAIFVGIISLRLLQSHLGNLHR